MTQNEPTAAAFDQAPFGASVRDHEGRVQAVNNALCELFELPRRQIVGQRIEDVAPRFAALGDSSVLQVVVEQRSTATRHVHISATATATELSLEVTDYPVFDTALGVQFAGQLVNDITSHQQARSNADALLALAAPHIASNLGTWTRIRRSGREIWSPQMYRLFGRNPDLGPVPLREFMERVSADERLAAEQAFRALHECDEPLDLELTISSDHGNTRTLHVTAIVDDDVERGLAQDITVARDVELVRERNIERYRHLFEDSPIALLVNDLDYNLTDVNPALCRMLGYDREQMMGFQIQDLAAAGDMTEIRAQRAALAAGTIESMKLEGPITCADGRSIWTSRESALLRSVSGAPFEIVTQVIDVSGAREQIQDLQRLADEDPLTGALNRRAFNARLAFEIDAVRQGARPGAVMMADVDKLKPVNDDFGHAAGDRLLMAFAHTLRRHIRSSDYIGRLGGDEFAVLMPGANRAQAERAAQAIVNSFRDGCQSELDRRLHPTISIGVAMLDGNALDGYEPLQAADTAMYRAKAAGGDRVQFDDDPAPTE